MARLVRICPVLRPDGVDRGTIRMYLAAYDQLACETRDSGQGRLEYGHDDGGAFGRQRADAEPVPAIEYRRLGPDCRGAPLGNIIPAADGKVPYISIKYRTLNTPGHVGSVAEMLPELWNVMMAPETPRTQEAARSH